MARQAPTIMDFPKRIKGESESDYWRRVERGLVGEDVRTKTDLQEWTGSLPFHLNKEND